MIIFGGEKLLSTDAVDTDKIARKY